MHSLGIHFVIRFAVMVYESLKIFPADALCAFPQGISTHCGENHCGDLVAVSK